MTHHILYWRSSTCCNSVCSEIHLAPLRVTIYEGHRLFYSRCVKTTSLLPGLHTGLLSFLRVFQIKIYQVSPQPILLSGYHLDNQPLNDGMRLNISSLVKSENLQEKINESDIFWGNLHTKQHLFQSLVPCFILWSCHIPGCNIPDFSAGVSLSWENQKC